MGRDAAGSGGSSVTSQKRSPLGIRDRDALWWVTTSVGALVVLLLTYLVVLIPTGTRAIPWKRSDSSSQTSAPTGTVADLQAALTKELTAYYGFDYRTIDTAIATVAAGSTGGFKVKIQGLSETLKEGAAQLKTVASAEVEQIAIHQISGSQATALAVVNQTLSNAQTAKRKKTATCSAGAVCSVYHLWVSYQLVSGLWKLSDLEYWQ